MDQYRMTDPNAFQGMANQIYATPVIQQDLRHEETIVQIADALDYLSTIVNDIFIRIESRMEKNSKKLEKLNQRSAIAKAKVEKLTGSHKASKVFSSAKYPASEAVQYYKSCFSTNNPITLKQSTQKIKSNHLPAIGQSLQEKLQFYHVKVSHKLLRRNIEIAPDEGLGSLPCDVDSISSLLLFNTSETPYKRYVMLDPLGAITKTRQALDEEGQKMEAAPISISHHEKMERQEGPSLFYSPGLGEVPLIDVPLDLPFLPGVADDLCYSMDSEPMIAPSVATTPALPELPHLVLESPSEPLSEPPLIIMASQALPPKPPTATTSLLPLPPPPPPLPPPPPPPPAQDIPSVTPPSIVAPSPAIPAASGQDARTNLMEAIRKAGGSRKALKSSNKKSIEVNKTKKEDKISSEGSGDLMADLHAKLAMRRKGISGVIKSNESSAMDRIKDMIPPPIERSTSNTEEDEDWE